MHASLHSGVVTLLGLVGACGALGLAHAGGYEELEHFEKGAIRGRVTLAGEPPAAKPLEVARDTAVCGTSTPSPTLVLGPGGGIGNAVVYLEGIARGKARSSRPPAVLEQRQCVFAPHVLVVPAGTDLEIVNHDPTLHTVHAKDPARRPATVFHIAQALIGQRTFVPASVLSAPPGEIRTLVLSCEVGHTWMSAWLFVVEHPYATVTAPDGTFVLSDVPAGEYAVTVWHELSAAPPGEAKRSVVVTAEKETEIEFPITLAP